MKKILLIENEKDIVEMLSAVLKHENKNYEIHSAGDGLSGLKKALKIKPDLILLDIVLPTLDGIEVCRRLKSDEEYKSIPIIMLTALDKSENIIKGLSAGADDYMSKPFNMLELLGRIKSHLTMKELYDTIKNNDEEKSALLDVSRALSSSIDPPETLYIVVSKIAGALEVKRCSIIYINPLNKKSFVMASHDSKGTKHLEIDINKYPEIQQVMKTGRPVIINDVYNDPILFPVRDVLNLIDVKSIMAFPVAFKNAIIGALLLSTSRREHPFNKREIRFCEVISHLAAAPLRNAYLFEILHEEKEKEQKARITAELERKRTEKALIRKEKSLAEAQRIANLGSWEWEIEKNNLYWSDETYQILGLKPHEFGASFEIFLNLVHPDDRDFFKKSVNNALYEKIPYNIDHRIILPDGEIRIMHGHAEVIFDENGKPVKMIGTIQDITERKKMEVDLSSSEERYRNLVQSIPDIIYKIDMKGHFVFVNNSVRNLGYEPHELTGKHFSEIIHPDDVKSVSFTMVIPEYTGKKTGDEKAPKFFDERRTGERMTKDLEVRLIRKNVYGKNEDSEMVGTITAFSDVSASGLYGAQGRDKKMGLIGTVGIIKDITEIKKSEEKQRKIEEHYRSMIENIFTFVPEGLLVFTDKFNLLKKNKALHDIAKKYSEKLGYSEKELEEIIIEQVKNNLQNKESKYLRICKKGNEFILELDSSRITFEEEEEEEEEEEVSIIVSLKDITERKKAEEALQNYSKRLVEIQESERKRISSELHDSLGVSLVTVKSEMINYLDILPATAKNIKGLETAIDTIDQIVEDVRKISHDLRPPQLDILGLTGAVKSIAEKLSHASGIEIHVKCEISDLKIPPEIEINLYRIVQEGLTNILKHSKASKASIELNSSKSFINLRISDNGKGFKIKSKNAPFDAEKEFGLQGMFERAKILGGYFEIDSKPGKGTVLTVTVSIDY